MRITQWGEYGVHLVMYMARMERDGSATVTAVDMADVHGLPIHYAQQILQRLRKGGVIDSVRGPHGGYRLTRSEEQITLYDILTAAEGDSLEIICESRPISEQCSSDTAPCSLKSLWYELRDYLDEFLKKMTLAELVKRGIDGSESSVLVRFPKTDKGNASVSAADKTFAGEVP